MKFISAFISTNDNTHGFTDEKQFHEFLKSDQAKKINSIIITETMTKQEYDKFYRNRTT